jgi:hypothetical protein
MEMVATQDANGVFNVSDYEAEDVAPMEVMGIDGDPLLYQGQQVVIRVYGPGSMQAVNASAKQQRAAQARMYAELRGKRSKETPDDARQQVIDELVARTKSIDNWPLTAEQTYANPKLGYIAEQVTTFGKEWANFKKGSTKI